MFPFAEKLMLSKLTLLFLWLGFLVLLLGSLGKAVRGLSDGC